LSLTIREATTLVEKIASNQGWNEERTQPCKRGGMNQVKEVDMLSAKMDLLMKKLDERDQQKKEVMHIHDSHMTFEECGGTSHTRSNCPKVQEDVNYINNNTNSCPQ
jgi:formylmethanofuran dehydrogenase subunit A